MGSPQNPTAEQYAKLEAAGQLELLESPRWIVPQGVSLIDLHGEHDELTNYPSRVDPLFGCSLAAAGPKCQAGLPGSLATHRNPHRGPRLANDVGREGRAVEPSFVAQRPAAYPRVGRMEPDAARCLVEAAHHAVSDGDRNVGHMGPRAHQDHHGFHGR